MPADIDAMRAMRKHFNAAVKAVNAVRTARRMSDLPEMDYHGRIARDEIRKALDAYREFGREIDDLVSELERYKLD